MADTRPLAWMGNRIHAEELPETELTLVQWYRPWNGTLRGIKVLDRREFRCVSAAVDEAANGHRDHPRLENVAGHPLDLETFLEDLLTR